MNKKQISTAVFLCVLGILSLILLYFTGFFDGSDKPLEQTTDNSAITTLWESTHQQETEEITEQETAAALAENTEKTEEISKAPVTDAEPTGKEYKFRNNNLLNQHYEKHGRDMGFENAQEYEKAASAVVNNPQALHKIEAEDGDDIYYIEATNEFVVVSTDGYIRTYFLPDRGIDYFNKQ